MGRRVALRIGIPVAVVFLVAGIAFSLRAIRAAETAVSQPVTQSRLVALASGSALPEDVAARVQKFGLAFTPDSEFRGLLRSAGASPMVLAAVDAAKVSPNATPAASANLKSLQSLANAGPLVGQKKYEGAARAVNDALTAGAPAADCGGR